MFTRLLQKHTKTILLVQSQIFRMSKMINKMHRKIPNCFSKTRFVASTDEIIQAVDQVICPSVDSTDINASIR